ncbi:MAG: tyrosine-type recombinase/integrase [Phycisphaerae bacterium]
MRDCDLKNEFLKFISYGKHRANRTINSYRSDLDQFVTFLSYENAETEKLEIVPISGQKTNRPEEQSASFLIKADTKKVRAFMSHLQRRNYSQASIRRKFATLLCFYNFLNSQHWLDYNPMTEIKPPKVKKHTPKILTDEQIWQLLHTPNLDNWLGARDRAMLELLCNTGIRVSELVNLNIGDVNLGNLQLAITSSNDKKRFISLTGAVAGTLNYYLKLMQRKTAFDDKNPQNPIFVNKFGTRLDVRSADRRIEKYIALAGLDKSITPYDFRHSFAQKLLRQGADIDELHRLFGFESTSATQLYVESLG